MYHNRVVGSFKEHTRPFGNLLSTHLKSVKYLPLNYEIIGRCSDIAGAKVDLPWCANDASCRKDELEIGCSYTDCISDQEI